MLPGSRELMNQAADAGYALFRQMSASGIIRKPQPHVGYLIILDGTLPYAPEGYTDALIVSKSFNPELWAPDKEYDKVARGKVMLAWRERMSTRDIVLNEPWRLKAGDCRYAGAVYRDGLVVGFSGVEAINDHALSEAVAAVVAAQLIAHAEQHLSQLKGAFIS